MAIASGILGTGQIATGAAAAFFTVAAATTAYVKTVVFSHESAVTQTVDVWVKKAAGTNRKLRRFVLAQYESAEIANLALGAGDALWGTTTTAAVLDFTVFGAQET